MAAGAVAGGERAGENQDRGDKRDGSSGPDGSADLADETVGEFDGVLDANRGDGREICGDRSQERAFLLIGGSGFGQRCQPGMGRAGEGRGREDHHEVDRQRLPLDLAEIGDLRGDGPSKNGDRHRVADRQAEFSGFLGGEGHQRFAGIVLGPPFARRQRRAFGQSGSIGDTAVAAQHPAAFRRHVLGIRRLAIERDDTAAQHRHGLDFAIGRQLCKPGAEGIDLARLDIDEEEVRRAVGQVAGDLAAQIGVDLRQCDEQRQPEAERQDHRRGERAGSVDVADGEPQRRRADRGRAAGDRLDQPAHEFENDEGGGDGQKEDAGHATIVGEQDG